MRARYFYGWNVVAATFVMALGSFGLGFYGLSVYVAMLQRLHGWSATAVSTPVTTYYVGGALLTIVIGEVYERVGPRVVVTAGSAAMAAGLAALGAVSEPWHLYPVFLVMSVGWGAMSGAAINIILAPWWDRRRGLAVSLAFNGATLGGVVVTPALMLLVDVMGFGRALVTAAIVLVVVLGGAAGLVMRRGPEELGLGPDGGESRRLGPSTRNGGGARREAMRTWRFWSVSAAFALGLAAQVGVLTHLVTCVTPLLGERGAARAIGLTTAAGVIGRLATGFVVDRVDRRLAASATLLVQTCGVVVLAHASSPGAAYAGCAIFGLGVGNLTSLPGLILGAEWPRDRFSSLVALVVGINQFTFAFGPSLVGVLRDWSNDYAVALGACAGLEAVGAGLIAMGRCRAGQTRAVPSDGAP